LEKSKGICGMSKPLSVVVIDDSAFMRKSISMMLESDPTIKVVATARDGQDGVQKVKQFKPDIVTLDVEMPVMDGITALKTIMRECPTPVLMISSITTEGAKVTLDALTAGAIDFIAKDRSFVSVQISGIRDELLAKVHEITSSRLVQLSMRRVHRSADAKPSPSAPAATSHAPVPSRSISKNYVSRNKNELKAVVLGISTGGPFALLQMLPKIRGNFPLPIAIVQHMPPNFTRSMAERLDAQCELSVREAVDGDVMKAGSVLIAPGGQHMVFQQRGDTISARITSEPKSTLYKPCADIMMLSAVETFRSGLFGVIMTGMGKDGLEGLRAIKQNSGYVLAQDEESCVVYGMPKAAVDDGIADAIVPLDGIAEAITHIVSGKFAAAA
jgi:two-component system, chemotaxis family, protein-glutamate methylesterase/glutaminase